MHAHNYAVNVKHNAGKIWSYNVKKPKYEFKVPWQLFLPFFHKTTYNKIFHWYKHAV